MIALLSSVRSSEPPDVLTVFVKLRSLMRTRLGDTGKRASYPERLPTTERIPATGEWRAHFDRS